MKSCFRNCILPFLCQLSKIVELDIVPHTSKRLFHHHTQPWCQCSIVIRQMAKLYASGFFTTYLCLQMLNQFTLYKLTDWGYSRSLFCTPFMFLWWMMMSLPQASPVSCLCIVLHRCLISSSQLAWQNSEVAADTELLWLCSSRDSPWRWRWECYYGDNWSQHLLMSHSRTKTFLDLDNNRGVSWSVCPSEGWKRSPQGQRCKELFRWL